MSAARDIKLNNDGDLEFVNGDFAIIKSDNQHVEDILIANVNHFKNLPTIGVNIISNLNSSTNNQKVRRLIKLHLKSDRLQVGEIIINNDIGQKEVDLPKMKRLNEPEGAI